MSEQADGLTAEVSDVIREHAGVGPWGDLTTCRCNGVEYETADWGLHVAAAVRAHLDDTRETEALLTPWGPYEMGGFEGCTNSNPEHCACATDVQPTCRICNQEIEPGELAWSRQWPCYDTLPLDHSDQDWDIISWHDECPSPDDTGDKP